MRVKIGKYTSWFGPYQLAQKLCFFLPEDHPFVYDFGKSLIEVSSVCAVLNWLDSKKKQVIQVQIDPWDTWSMDVTLSHIILPMLRQLKETAHGAPLVDDDDVPEELRSTKKEGDDGTFARWNYVMDEMIYAFESISNDDFDSQFWSGSVSEGTFKVDVPAMEVAHARISKGTALFGKYYRGLWD
jgi:hypothetical protein